MCGNHGERKPAPRNGRQAPRPRARVRGIFFLSFLLLMCRGSGLSLISSTAPPLAPFPLRARASLWLPDRGQCPGEEGPRGGCAGGRRGRPGANGRATMRIWGGAGMEPPPLQLGSTPAELQAGLFNPAGLSRAPLPGRLNSQERRHKAESFWLPVLDKLSPKTRRFWEPYLRCARHQSVRTDAPAVSIQFACTHRAPR